MKEDLLIDLDLPPSINKTPTKKQTNSNNISILDEPIDVPEIGKLLNITIQAIFSPLLHLHVKGDSFTIFVFSHFFLQY